MISRGNEAVKTIVKWAHAIQHPVVPVVGVTRGG